MYAVETCEDSVLNDATCNSLNVRKNTYSGDNLGDSCLSEVYFKDCKDSVESEAIKNESEKVLAKTDGLMGHINQEVVIDNLEDHVMTKTSDVYHISDDNITYNDNDSTDDSTDDSSDDDTEEEYMPDGELVRKNTGGFKQLVNCKKFWEASQMLGKRK